MQVEKIRSNCYAAAVGVLLTVSSQAALAQSDSQAWVSDELSTYVRSGPTDGYRIVGTLNAGEQVEVLETSGDYTRVRSNSGDTVWVLSNELQQTPSARQQLPELQAQVEELTQELDGINDTWEQRVSSMTETLDIREQRIADLEARNAELDNQAEQSRQQVRALQARLDTQEEDLLMRYFMYGGGVAGAGLLVGLIVPHLPRRRKKRDRWF
ncbi:MULTISPECIES: TIGR04211 family SH3 domain-containing protein [Halomonadaceae]|jgi:SH3 domain protein|uniref:SH3 domain-containing protein n=1 Tax=Vreelandella piezotolerans TaxID=2609667 RepID=A0ABQ6XFR8_9GAMM|nr:MULTISPECIES: TIGR04211 family SH3 domain-containing protein [Halomonas]KAE8440165.1 SH3 domain-containing protein [Halomonas piezotolerans]MCG7576716.1 SH3 domain-containing protein [Halomonas sp. MMH1-48]MCG7590796.1 SH3 domain-containing protein [Halomonas sp. McD50-5]MCG7603779.1 SH3 domain-containing protein [Halomonas sp. MM17-34]MCG7613029.1 SH3 domain-containing protein [Halomonas sp. MM17-29]